jgi:BON domain
MLKNILTSVIIGCVVLPLGLFGASESPAERSAKAEQELAAKIRKSVAKDASLPPASRNVDVTIENGVVTLKGTVQSDAESQAIQGKAESVVIQETHHEQAADTPRVKVANQIVVSAR